MAMREPLSRERVLAAAMALADAEGLQAVTMRRVASDLGVEAMSLYHHLPGKNGLLDGLVEEVAAEMGAEIATVVASLGEAPDWRAELRGRCLSARKTMLRHPWAPGLLGSRTSIPAGILALYEGVLATLIRGGFSYHLGHRALHALGSMVLGFVQELFSPVQGGRATDAEASAEKMAQMAETLPQLAAMVAAEVHTAGDATLGWCDSQAEFEFTLDLLIDGLERARSDACRAE